MLNQVVVIGRITDVIKVDETENGKKVANLVIAVPRAYKNSDGIYDTDFIRCTLWNNVAVNTSEYCQKGDLIGIRGRLQSNSYEDKDGNRKYGLEVVADKVTFLSKSEINKDDKDDKDER